MCLYFITVHMFIQLVNILHQTDQYNFLQENQLNALISQIYSWDETTGFGQFLCPSSEVFHCTQQMYMSYRFANNSMHFHPDTACKLSENPYDVHHCRVYNEKLPNDGQRNCPKHA
jgi:hypothetical protein